MRLLRLKTIIGRLSYGGSEELAGLAGRGLLHRGLKGNDARLVDLNGDGALQQGDGEQEAVIFFHLDEDAFESGEGAVLDANTPAGCDVFPGFGSDARLEDAVDGSDFAGFDGARRPAETDDSDDTRRGHDGQAIARAKPAKQITREEREVQFLGPVGPSPPGAPGAIKGKELFEALVAQGEGGDSG